VGETSVLEPVEGTVRVHDGENHRQWPLIRFLPVGFNESDCGDPDSDIATVIVSGWLFLQLDVISEPLSIVLPIVLCGCILPIVKLAGEKCIAE
jgi:hypothetical protein